MKKSAVIFPGQGAQYVGMGAGLLESQSGREIMDRACDVLGFNLSELCLNGPAQDLTRTDNSQVALFTLGYMGYSLLKESMPSDWRPDYVAGLSLGEFTALAVAGVFSFEDGLRLVRKRGEFMINACREREGAMASVIGADRDTLSAVIEDIRKTGKVINMANLNCPGQIVVSGEKDAVVATADRLEADGFRVVMLQVSGAFHSPLMESAQKKLADVVDSITFNDPKIPVVCNCDAGIKTKADDIKRAIIDQMVSSVLWEDSVNLMIANGVELFIEPGCGKVLKGLLRRINRKMTCVSIEKPDNISSVTSVLC